MYFIEQSRLLLEDLHLEDGLDKASNISCIATILTKKGDYATADSLMANAVGQIRAVFGDKNVMTANYYYNYANLLAKAGNIKKALRMSNTALAALGYKFGCQWDTIVHADQLLENLTQKNRLAIELYEQSRRVEAKKEIESTWTESLRLLDYLHRRYQGTTSKLRFASHFNATAESAIQWYAHQSNKNSNEAAWVFAEKAHALILLEAFRKANAWNNKISENNKTTANDSLLLLSDAFAAEQKKWRDAYAAAENDTVRADILLKLIKTNEKQEQWLKALERQDSVFFKAKYDTHVITPANARHLLAPDQALLEYFVGDSSIYIFVVRPDTLIVREVRRDFPLEDWVEAFREGLSACHSLPEHLQTDALQEKAILQYTTYAPKLHEKLIAPVDSWLLKKVVIVPDGCLGGISFDALLTRPPKNINVFSQYPYLFNDHQFSYTNSATLLQEMREKKHLPKPTKTLAAFAPFCVGNTAPAPVNRASNDTIKWVPLPFAKKEVEKIKELMGPNAVAVLDTAATKNRFLSIAHQYRILHLATHGLANNHAGEQSFLAFFDAKGQSESGKLHVKDVYGLRLKADLVVLSACETGIGKLQRGEGIISLGRAFAYAGAESVAASLWKVNTENTAKLMELFYLELRSGKPKDEALYEAKRRFMANASEYEKHPFFWAGFVLMGDMRSIR